MASNQRQLGAPGSMGLAPVVLLDLDGTLTDPKDGITRSIRYALERLARPSPDDADLLFAIGPPLRASFARLMKTEDAEAIEVAMTLYRERFATVGLFENRVYDGIPEMLAALKHNGCKLLLATAKPHVYALQILEHFKLLTHFDGIYGSELDGTRQHKADLLDHLLTCEKLDPAYRLTVMVGDRHHDIDAAHANGCGAMAVSWGYGSEAELAHADMIATCPAEIVKVLAKRYSLR